MNTTKIASAAEERRGLLLMIISVILFAATSLLLSYANQAHKVDAWVASVYRAGIGLAVVYSMQKSMGRLKLKNILTNKYLFARGFIGGMTIPFFYLTIMELGAGRAGIITGSFPLFATIFAAMFIGERLSVRYFIYISLALTGVILIFAEKGIGPSKPIYDLIALAGAAAAGVCVVLIRHLRHTETTSNIFAAQCVFTLIFGLIGAGRELLISDPRALGLVLLATLTVVGGQLCITEAFREISVRVGSTLQILNPALTAIGSAALLGEHFSLLEVFGGFAILYASYQIVMQKSRP